MSKLPIISGRALVRALRGVGFEFDREKGSHMILYRAEPVTTLSVPDHRELYSGRLDSTLTGGWMTGNRLSLGRWSPS